MVASENIENLWAVLQGYVWGCTGAGCARSMYDSAKTVSLSGFCAQKCEKLGVGQFNVEHHPPIFGKSLSVYSMDGRNIPSYAWKNCSHVPQIGGSENGCAKHACGLSLELDNGWHAQKHLAEHWTRGRSEMCKARIRCSHTGETRWRNCYRILVKTRLYVWWGSWPTLIAEFNHTRLVWSNRGAS